MAYELIAFTDWIGFPVHQYVQFVSDVRNVAIQVVSHDDSLLRFHASENFFHLFYVNGHQAREWFIEQAKWRT